MADADDSSSGSDLDDFLGLGDGINLADAEDEEIDPAEEEAARERERAQHEADAAAAMRAARAAKAECRYEDAVAHCTRAFLRDPKATAPLLLRSGCFLGLRKWEAAAHDARRCVSMAPKEIKGYYQLSAALLGMGQAQDATDTLREGMRLHPGDEDCVKLMQQCLAHLGHGDRGGNSGGGLGGGGGGGAGVGEGRQVSRAGRAKVPLARTLKEQAARADKAAGGAGGSPGVGDTGKNRRKRLTVAESQELLELKQRCDEKTHELAQARAHKEALEHALDGTQRSADAVSAMSTSGASAFVRAGRMFVREDAETLTKQLGEEKSRLTDAVDEVVAHSAEIERQLLSCEENVRTILESDS